MSSSASNAIRHRRAVSLGLSASVAAHVAILATAQFTLQGEAESENPGVARTLDPFDAVELVQLEQVEPAERAEPTAEPDIATSSMTSAAGAASDFEATAAASAGSLDALLASLEPARIPPTALRAEGRPVVTFSDLDPLSDDMELMAALYGDLFAEEEPEAGGIGGLLDAIGAALSGGGHCPTPATGSGPLILR